jgi:hypothetical protein
MSGPRVTVQIDRLVLRGMDAQHKQAFAQSLQSELARVLGNPQAHAAMAASASTPNLRLGRLPMQPGASGARALAASVARSVAGGITKGRAR